MFSGVDLCTLSQIAQMLWFSVMMLTKGIAKQIAKLAICSFGFFLFERYRGSGNPLRIAGKEEYNNIVICNPRYNSKTSTSKKRDSKTQAPAQVMSAPASCAHRFSINTEILFFFNVVTL